MSKFYIFAGGNTDCDVVREFFEKEKDDNQQIIAADSGLNELHHMGVKPDILLGDFDSVDKDILDLYLGDESIVFERFPSHKDYTDMELAIDMALREGADDIVVFGAIGTRLDHVLGSIGTLHTALKMGVRARIVDAHNIIELIEPGHYLLRRDEMFGKYVSYLAYSKRVKGITLRGFEYNLENATFKKGSSLGVSNEIVNDEATIDFKEGTLIFIQSKD